MSEHRALVHGRWVATSALLLTLFLLCTIPQIARSISSVSLETATKQSSIKQQSPTTTPATITSSQSVSNQTNCKTTIPCSTAEFLAIFTSLNQNGDLLSRFQTINNNGSRSATKRASNSTRVANDGTQPNIRMECVRELIWLIRNLASDELEMKSVLEFASGTGSLAKQPPLPIGANSNKRRGSTEVNTSCPNQTTADLAGGVKQAPLGTNSVVRSNQQEYLLVAEDNGSAERSKVMPKVVARVNHYIDSLERFTLTKEWSSVMKVFQGVESILALFVSKNKTLTAANSTTKSELPTTSLGQAQKNYGQRLMASNGTANGTNVTSLATNKTKTIQIPSSSRTKDEIEALLADLRQNLPVEVQTLTTALGNLFPWHVWPWNNADLYTTIETFLNHGIFAFSKTTSGPERRIDYLSDMLQTLFKSLKFDSFPKKCNDWSKVICEPEKFHDRLVLGPLESPSADSPTTNATQEREVKIKQLLKEPRNLLTGELTCIMFSSLSMQQFGASAKDLQGQDEAAAWASMAASRSLSQQRLAWDRLVHKALKLYGLAREALTDEQWGSLYKLMNDLWLRQKISDRVIMVGRVVQLLTNCHMPREMLESALWKDIYKYKNALNQLSDIVIEELNRSSENGKFTIEQLSLGSRNLNEILVRFMRILPRLLEALSRTVVDQLPDLVNKFFTDKVSFFQTPCKGNSLADLIPNLDDHRTEILELENLICAQLNTKPSFSMMQINNLTNELLAMAFNFSNFGQAFAIPASFLSNLQNPAGAPSNIPAASRALTVPKSARLSSNSAELVDLTTTTTNQPMTGARNSTENVTSIVDELVANSRLQAIVAILQSSPLDPPEVHAELPELDWVEAGTSVALLYESIQRLLSFDGQFVIFPEVENYQVELMSGVDKSRQLFKKFSKRDPIRLFAYVLDALMPIAIRTFKPMESFYAECHTTLRDLFNQVPEGSTSGSEVDSTTPNQGGVSAGQPAISRESRQWQCVISSLNFGAHALDKLIATFNSMLESVLAQASALHAGGTGSSKSSQSTKSINETATNKCLLFDGTLTKLLDNWPQVMEIALESVLVASTSSSDQQVGLYDTICNGNYSLDPFSETMSQVEVQKMRAAMCRLASKSSLSECSRVLKLDEWRFTMQHLNRTWFETNAINVEPAFRATILRVHEFLILFGRVKPSSWSDSLLARILNVNSFWDGMLNKTVSTVERYQDRRLELGLQTSEPIVYDNLLALSNCRPITTLSATEAPDQTSIQRQHQETCQPTRKLLMISIASARAIIEYLNSTGINTGQDSTTSVQGKLKTLVQLTDKYSLPVAESLLRTIATNSSKLESLLARTNTSEQQIYSPITMVQVFDRFCLAPVDSYLELNFTLETAESQGQSINASQRMREQLTSFQHELCQFNWTQFQDQLESQVSDRLANYPIRQLTRVALTKWGQALDLIMKLSGDVARLPAFLQVNHWKPFHAQLSIITPLREQPSNFIWIWQGIGRLLQAADSESNQLVDAFARTLDQLNCALDSLKGGLSWENLANIYSDRQEILAAHSTINNGFVLASIGVSTFMAPKKFQRLLDEFVRPMRQQNGTNSAIFCEMRDKNKWETILALPNEAVDFAGAIESFQELICDTNFETLPQSVNPISVCYQTSFSTNANGTRAGGGQQQLAEMLDRSFKLASLAAMDAKLVAANDARPPIFDKGQWSSFWDWWSTQPAAEPRGGLALALVRAFQTLDSMNFGHVIWRAVFKTVHEVSELLAYLVRATEQRQQQLLAASPPSSQSQVATATNTRLASATSENKVATSTAVAKKIQPQQVVSTLSSLIFPEQSNIIPLKTFKQLRYIKSIADYFTMTPEAQESVCRQQQVGTNQLAPIEQLTGKQVELIGFKLDSSAKLNTLLCHYHSSQWLTALNIVISARASSLTKRVNYMTKYLSLFVRQYKDYDNLESFIHARQMDNIETVANATVSHLLAASYSLRGSLSFAKLSNVSWSSMPTVLESIDKQLCDSSGAEFGIHNLQQLISFRSFASLEPKKPDLETLICKLPQWNVSQIYEYLSASFDLQKMISLVTQPMNMTAPVAPKLNATASSSTFDFLASKLFKLSNNTSSEPSKQQPQNACTTPFKLASKWLKVVQETVVQAKSKATREKIRKCLSAQTKNQSLCTQSLRYVRVFNRLLNNINDLTRKNSWVQVRKTWNSISYHLINTNQQQSHQLRM